MIIYHNSKTLESHYFTQWESVWKMCDVLDVIDYYRSKNRIILGGDILTLDSKYTYDNWYYNDDPEKDVAHNVAEGYRIATEYLKKYIARNGDSYYVVLVIKKKYPPISDFSD